METNTAFRVLEITQTKDESFISEAYRKLLPTYNPEDDAEGFKRLRMAYETAMTYARTVEKEITQVDEPVTDIDIWINKVEKAYNDISSRSNIEAWNKLLDDDICTNLDTSIEAREKLLVFLLENHYLPQKVWKKIDQVFLLSEDKEQLSDIFPIDFLEYILYYAYHEGVDSLIPFDFFEYISLDDEHGKIDDYIEQLLRIRREIDVGEDKQCFTELDDLKDYDIYHPAEDVERLRIYIRYFENEVEAAELRKANKELPDNEKKPVPDENIQLTNEYKDKCRRLIDKLSEIPPEYIYAYTNIGEALWFLGETDKAYVMWQALLKDNSEAYYVRYCVARHLYTIGQYEKAGEMVEELGQENETDMVLYNLLNKINRVLIVKYQEQLERGEENEKYPGQKLKLELGWKLWQNERVDEAVALLESFEPDEKNLYGYCNLFGRMLYQKKDYSRALKYLKKWKEMLMNLEGLDEEEKGKRLKRRCLAFRCLAGCLTETGEEANAEETIKQALEFADSRVEKVQGLYQYAVMLLRWERYNDTIDICDRIIDEDRQYYPAYLIHQEACFELQKAREVVEDYENAVNIANDYYKPYMYAALVYYYYGQYSDSMEVINRARKNKTEFSLKMRFLEIQVKRHLVKEQDDREKLIAELELLQKEVQERISKGCKYDEDIETVYGMKKDELPEINEIYCEKAYLYEGCNEYDKAVTEINRAIDISHNPRYYCIKGDILSDDGNKAGIERFSSAVTCYKHALKEISDNPWVYYSLGYCYERLNEMEKAVEQYQKALDIRAPYENICERLIDYYLDIYSRTHEMRYINKAIDYADIETGSEETGYSLWLKGKVLEYGDNMEEAVKNYERSLEIEDKYTVALLRLGNCYRRMMNYDKAIEYIEKCILSLNGRKRSLPYINMGMCYECKGDYKKAIEYYKEAMENGADEEEMWQDIGDCYRYLENYSAAMEAYSHAEKEEYNVNCSEIAYAKGEAKRAEQLYKKSISKLQMELSKTINSLNVDTRKRGNDISKKLAYRYVMLGDFYLEYFQDYKKAVSSFEKAIFYDNSDETGWKAYVGMIKSYFMADKPKKAEKCAEKAMMIFQNMYSVTEEEFLIAAPYRAIYLGRFGWTYLGLGDTKKAMHYFKEMERTTLCTNCKHKGCFESSLFKGIVYYILGDIGKAQQAFKEAVKRNPYDVFSIQMLKKVEI